MTPGLRHFLELVLLLEERTSRSVPGVRLLMDCRRGSGHREDHGIRHTPEEVDY